MTKDAEIIVVGAGLSGLSLAQALKANGRNVILLEGRDRVGGRILSQDGYDLGPAWIWSHQTRMLGLIGRLGLKTFPQHSTGHLVFEDARGQLRRDLDFATMGGALRIAGGLSQLTDALAKDLGDVLQLGQIVRHVQEDGSGVIVATSDRTFKAARAVLALPPRLAARMGVTVPDVPSWMAGHAKLAAVYDTPFWRSAGLNGDAISHRGPLAEIHDASPDTLTSGALFGFAVPGAARDPDFKDKAIAQLTRTFGPMAAHPQQVYIKDWSTDPATATPADLDPPYVHPDYRPIAHQGRITLAGTEVAAAEGGFLEGALVAAEAAFDHLTRVPA